MKIKKSLLLSGRKVMDSIIREIYEDSYDMMSGHGETMKDTVDWFYSKYDGQIPLNFITKIVRDAKNRLVQEGRY